MSSMIPFLDQMKIEQKPWVLHNFGERESWQPLLGIMEELGELTEAYNFETDENERNEKIKDAIADITIYITDYCNVMNFDITQLYMTGTTGRAFTTTSGWNKILNLMIQVGRISHAHLKHAQKIRVSENHIENAKKFVGEALFVIEELCMNIGYSYYNVVSKTWNDVKTRDWKKFPKNGKTE